VPLIEFPIRSSVFTVFKVLLFSLIISFIYATDEDNYPSDFVKRSASRRVTAVQHDDVGSRLGGRHARDSGYRQRGRFNAGGLFAARKLPSVWTLLPEQEQHVPRAGGRRRRRRRRGEADGDSVLLRCRLPRRRRLL